MSVFLANAEGLLLTSRRVPLICRCNMVAHVGDGPKVSAGESPAST
jgi:hypothetical protein